MTMHDPPEGLDEEEKLMWTTADGFARSLLRRISIARQETEQMREALLQVADAEHMDETYHHVKVKLPVLLLRKIHVLLKRDVAS